LMAERDYEVLEEAFDPNALDVKKSFLESEGIQCAILGEHHARLAFFGSPFRARLIVRADQVEEALKLLATFE